MLVHLESFINSTRKIIMEKVKNNLLTDSEIALAIISVHTIPKHSHSAFRVVNVKDGGKKA